MSIPAWTVSYIKPTTDSKFFFGRIFTFWFSKEDALEFYNEKEKQGNIPHMREFIPRIDLLLMSEQDIGKYNQQSFP